MKSYSKVDESEERKKSFLEEMTNRLDVTQISRGTIEDKKDGKQGVS